MLTHERGILLVEANRRWAPAVLRRLAGRGVYGQLATSTRAAMQRMTEGNWAAILLDEGCLESGLQPVLTGLRRVAPELPVVLVSREPGAADVLAAMRAGCCDMLTGEADDAAVDALLDRLSIWGVGQADSPGLIVGSSEAIRATLDLARRVAPTSLPVLVAGESGTGKELISQYIHIHSRRADGPFVQVNCAALNESLLESELFGHEKGAFTGAIARREGRFERADGGTLLLDEISETTPRLQAELLRVLEGQDLERVGGTETLRVNVRVIATTNRDLAGEVEAGRFRRDLYYRIGGVRLDVPALRSRSSDVEALTWHFVRRYAGESGRAIERIDRDLLETMRRATWPGNVRQLRNCVRTLLALGAGPVLSLSDAPQLAGELESAALCPSRSDSLRLQELERRAIYEALRRTKDHQARAARLLGITDRTLREKLRRYRTAQAAAQAKGEPACHELPA